MSVLINVISIIIAILLPFVLAGLIVFVIVQSGLADRSRAKHHYRGRHH